MLPHDNRAKNTTIKVTEEKDHSEKLLQARLSINSLNVLMAHMDVLDPHFLREEIIPLLLSRY